MFRSIANRIRVLHDSGITNIAAGTSILGYVAMDSYRGTNALSRRQDELHQLEADYTWRKEENERRKAQVYGRKLADVYGDAERQHLHRIVFVPPAEKVEGPMALTGHDVEVGDVVEVLAEGVGPGNAFHLCRVRNSVNSAPADGGGYAQDAEVDLQIGWYPIKYLQNMSINI